MRAGRRGLDSEHGPRRAKALADTPQASARGETVRALDSVRDLVANDEAEIAIDHLINTVNAFRLTLRQDEHDRLMSAAARLNYADSVTDIDPRLLVPVPVPAPDTTSDGLSPGNAVGSTWLKLNF